MAGEDRTAILVKRGLESVRVFFKLLFGNKLTGAATIMIAILILTAVFAP